LLLSIVIVFKLKQIYTKGTYQNVSQD
jgi:hypothetical protein